MGLEPGADSGFYPRNMKLDQAGDRLPVSEIATRAGVHRETVRYYERIGLLPKPARTTGDHRRYGPATVDRLLFIRGAQRLGLRLAEIAELLAVRDTGRCPCEPAEELLHRRVTEIDAELARLTKLRADLTGMLATMARQDCSEPVIWCDDQKGGELNVSVL